MPKTAPVAKEANAAEMIADELGERDFDARRQLAEVVQALGEVVAFTLLEQTLEIQDQGGLKVPDGSRRRTPGGVFFFLARPKLSREAKQRIFYGKGRGATDDATIAKPVVVDERPSLRPRRRVVEVGRELDGSNARPRSSEKPKLAIATEVDAARTRIARALQPLSPAEQKALLDEFVAGLALPRATARPTKQREPRARPSPAEGTKSAFVLSLPLDMPAKWVVERARAEGISLSASHVYSIRGAARRRSG